ncbi:MAG: peptide chain release factor N(5)-glutamine methyltransferase [Planctomycetes bacterium]|jgi:release factor glutamine methyltransferase|nr:peptide chain release factor N(5)-glutamine methyltransferase [Phycisphaerae bacterium]NBB95010.1 peptide chain release factor N(5)-glutamine methyltransferase [Planctomycetota bacterium]
MPANNERWTVLRLLNWTRDYFSKAGLDSPRLCAEMLLAECLGSQRIDLYARGHDEPDEAVRGRFREMVRRAVDGEPVAYIVGRKEFFSLPFKVTADVLIPRAETELLVDQAVNELRLRGGGDCWDACTGSGCVAVAVAANVEEARVLATDVSPEAVAIAVENAEANGVGDRVTTAVADLLTLPEAWDHEATFDVITANPPYVADDDEVGHGVDREPAVALRAGPTGLAIIRRLLPQAPAMLKDEGLLCVEFGMGQVDEVRDTIMATGAFYEPEILTDTQDLERAAVARRRPQ